MAANLINMPVSRVDNFHFEYTLKLEKCQVEGVNYMGIGVVATMIDARGNEVAEYIRDVTTEPEVAQQLMHLLDVCKVSPMCLKMFVEDFLACL